MDYENEEGMGGVGYSLKRNEIHTITFTLYWLVV